MILGITATARITTNVGPDWLYPRPRHDQLCPNGSIHRFWWAAVDSNHLPPQYQALSAAPTIFGNSNLASAAASVMW